MAGSNRTLEYDDGVLADVIRGAEDETVIEGLAKKMFEMAPKYGLDEQDVREILMSYSTVAAASGPVNLNVEMSIDLANPYHDIAGRFTDIKHAVTIIGKTFGTHLGMESAKLLKSKKFLASAAVVLGEGALGEVGYTKEDRRRAASVIRDVTKRVPKGLRNPNAVVRVHKSLTSYMLASGIKRRFSSSAVFVREPGARRIHLNPYVAGLLRRERRTKREDDFVKRTIAYGMVRGRPRARKQGFLSRIFGSGLENGLSESLIGSKMKIPRHPANIKQSDAVSRIALYMGDGNRRKANAWADEKHLNGSSWAEIARDLSAKTGKRISPIGVYAYVRWNAGRISDLIGGAHGGYSDLTGMRTIERGDVRSRRFIIDTVHAAGLTAVSVSVKKAIINAIKDTVKDLAGFGDTDLSFVEQMAKAKSLEEVELANPYHDKAGKFTSKEYAVDSGLFNDTLSGVSSRISGINKVGFGKAEDSVYKNYPGIDKSLGFWSPEEGKVFFTERGRKMMSKNKEFARYVITHEIIHSRARKGGAKFLTKDKNILKYEEAMTDMLSAYMVGSAKYMSYRPYVNYVSYLAYVASNGDVEKAWKWVNMVHASNDGKSIEFPPMKMSRNSRYTEWMLKGTPKSLEEDDEYIQAWKESERAKWSMIYGIDFDPFSDEEEENENSERDQG